MAAQPNLTPADMPLPRVLGLRDVVLLYAIAIVSLQWLSTAAQLGPASLALWLVSLAIFFVPSGFLVMELSSRYDGEGGLYVWVKQAFGDAHGFLAGWSYVVSNLVFLPTVLLFLSGAVTYVAAETWPSIKDSPALAGAISLSVLWLVVGGNILGLRRARWIANGCAVAMGAVLVLLIACAAVSVWRFGSTSAFNRAAVPNLADPSLLKSVATMMFALTGLELAPLMGSEIREPRRVIPRAIIVAGALIAAFYLLGTSALLVALPSEQIEAITGIPQCIAAIAARIGLPVLGPVAALLMTLGSTGVLAAWVTGTARLPYVVGLDRHLPEALGRLHRRWRSPHVALMVIGAITSLLVVAGLAGSTLREAYQMLVDMTVAMTFLPVAYMFAALPVLRARRVGERPGLLLVPGGRAGVALVSGLGLASTLLAIGFALVPPDGGPVGIFYVKLVGGSALFLALGFAFYRRGNDGRGARPESAGAATPLCASSIAANASALTGRLK